MDPLTLGLLAAVLIFFLWIVARQNELFYVSIRGGRVLVVRGRVPPGYLGDLKDIVKNVPRGSVRAVKQDGHARIVASGVDERTLQRLRNAFGVYPASKLRAAPPIQSPTLGQILGIAWLAWLLDRR